MVYQLRDFCGGVIGIVELHCPHNLVRNRLSTVFIFLCLGIVYLKVFSLQVSLGGKQTIGLCQVITVRQMQGFINPTLGTYWHRRIGNIDWG